MPEIWKEKRLELTCLIGEFTADCVYWQRVRVALQVDTHYMNKSPIYRHVRLKVLNNETKKVMECTIFLSSVL